MRTTTMLRARSLAALASCLLAIPAAAAGAEIPAVGATAPDFTLTALSGETVRLSAALADGPVVLVMLRGYPGYQCPLCTRQVAELARVLTPTAAPGVRVLLVYPGPADGLKARAGEFVAGKALPANFRLLLDPDYTFTNAYGLRWDAPSETAYPSTFVLDKGGVVRFATVSRSHGGRAKTADVLSAVKALR